MNDNIHRILSSLQLDKDKIYSSIFESKTQTEEIELREKNASKRQNKDFLKIIPQHHSIPVMDHEVRRALSMIPSNAIILDVGGGIGWHWRHLYRDRPDISVVILDFIRSNLLRTKGFLEKMINHQIR